MAFPVTRARRGSYQSQQQEHRQEQGRVCTGGWQKCLRIWMSAPSSSWAMAQRPMRRTGRGEPPACTQAQSMPQPMSYCTPAGKHLVLIILLTSDRLVTVGVYLAKHFALVRPPLPDMPKALCGIAGRASARLPLEQHGRQKRPAAAGTACRPETSAQSPRSCCCTST